MKSKVTSLFIFLLFSLSLKVFAQDPVLVNMAGSAYLDNQSYNFLERVCDEAGARMMGNPQNEKAVSILKSELERIGAPVKLESFKAIAWFPGTASLTVEEPMNKELKTFASSQCGTFAPFEAQLIYCKYGFEEDYTGIDVTKKLVLVSAETPPDGRRLLNMEAVEIARKHGAAGIIIHHKFPGTMVYSTSGNYNGVPLEIPAFNITYDEGKWLQRLLEKKIPVKIKASTTSYLKEVESSNVIVTFPGKVKDKIVLGCHFDSPERGQGAIDNGSGSAIAYDVARLINSYSPVNYYTIEIAWFNGEETGLWGSKKYVAKHRDENIRVMINMDMLSIPSGFNTNGFNEFKPFLESLIKKLNGFNLTDGITETMGTNTDYVSFYREGIPVMNILSKRDEPKFEYAHELGDTFDKVNKKSLSEAAAVVSILIRELANEREIITNRRSKDEITTQCSNYGVLDILIREKEWPWINR
jgi:hypothetical protein